LKLYLPSVDHFYGFLVGTLQKIEGVHSTDSNIILNTVVQREISL